MTVNTDTITSTTTAPGDGSDTTTTSTDPAATDTTTEAPSGNSEAARYRTQLRATETERDALAARVTAYQRRDAEAAVGGILEVPGDLFDIGGATLADFFDDDGNVLEDELRAAAAALVTERPRLATDAHAAASGPRQWGQGGNGKGAPAKKSWADVVGKR